MYEQLLKWGLDSLNKFAGIKGEFELSILTEAIKTKNAIILERYKQCCSLNEGLISLSVEVEVDLSKFIQNKTEADTNWKTARAFIGQLKTDFHPEHYRKLCKIRSSFDSTNDLISAYSYTFLDVVKIDNLIKIAKENKCYSIGDICRLYRSLWAKYTENVAVLLRVTSGDLRFWITDTPYVILADEWAKLDLSLCIQSLSNEKRDTRFHISLETKKGLDKFWYELKNHHEKNKKN
jgi:hypothetical protein